MADLDRFFKLNIHNYRCRFNIFEKVDARHRHLVASGLISVFKKLWADSWGPRLEYILRNAVLALLDYPNSTLLGVNKMLLDEGYRRDVLNHVKDPVVKAYWEEEYAGYNSRFRQEAISPIQNKVGQFLSVPLIRNIVGQFNSSFSVRDVMDRKKLLIMNLSKGKIGEDNSALLGAMMITKIQLAAMSRVDIPENERRDFYLYVDEFQNFVATDSFASILSEARKYRLNLILAHQYIRQLIDGYNTTIKDAVFGNVGSMVSFRVGANDAKMLQDEFKPCFRAEDFTKLAKYNVYVKLMINGVASRPFSAETLPPININGDAEKIIRVSRERWASRRKKVEEKINKWLGN